MQKLDLIEIIGRRRGGVGDSYLLMVRPSPRVPAVELRFQFRYAPAQQPRLLTLDADSLWFEPFNAPPTFQSRRKVETADVDVWSPLRFRSLQSTPATHHGSI